ncbi:MAG TPA: type II toxin-antitoxin system VapC family toxin [Candidatus Hydrogenedentes bacterium]|nr:type II toxin-antitoxin system VapC family toxin [Candidatus Hydrogenedentota bacterium]HPG69941.1 type II toxin-antitoxin system VapC family toxin [Candidatus Hydrogenedentota bacterium]
MNVVDSCGWLEYFANGPNADHFAGPVEGTSDLVVPTLCIYEVFRRLLQQRGRSEALEAVAAMRQATVVPLTDTLAMEAAALGHELKLPMADSVILATARAFDATLWTQDADFCSVPGVQYFARAADDGDAGTN